MLHPPSPSLTHATPAQMEAIRRRKLSPAEQADVIGYDWAQVGFGILLAGGAYPLVAAAILTLVGIVGGAFQVLASGAAGQPVDGTFLVVLPQMVIFSLFVSPIALIWTAVVIGVVLPLLYLVVWSLHLKGSIVWLGAFAGGLVGFVAILPLTLSLSFAIGARQPDLWPLILLGMGPGLTTVLGQIGGAWGGMRSRETGLIRAPEEILAVAGGWQDKSAAEPDASAEPREAAPQAKFQFGIRHLLWIAVWLSLLLTLIRLSRIPFEYAIPLLVGWLLFQSATLWIGGRLARKLGPWWARRRQARST